MLCALAATLLLGLVGCLGADAPSPGSAAEAPGPTGEAGEAGRTGSSAGEPAELRPRPTGGTLREAEVSLSLREGDLLIRIVPLDESVIRLTAPDTYRRLQGLARGSRAARGPDPWAAGATLFLVSVFSRSPGVEYEPEALNLLDRGRRFRPLSIRPVTPEWGARRLEQEEVRAAIYAFAPEIDLGSPDLVATYRGARSEEWSEIRRRLDAERARVGG